MLTKGQAIDLVPPRSQTHSLPLRTCRDRGCKLPSDDSVIGVNTTRCWAEWDVGLVGVTDCCGEFRSHPSPATQPGLWAEAGREGRLKHPRSPLAGWWGLSSCPPPPLPLPSPEPEGQTIFSQAWATAAALRV